MVVLMVAGYSANVYLVVAFTQAVVAELLPVVIGKRRMERDLARLQGHFIICGWGRMGQEITDQFLRKQAPFVVIELNPEKCQQLAARGILHVRGDASDDTTLRTAGIERAAGLVSVAPTDAHNIFITLSARALNRDLYIVARSIYDQDVHKLELAGANRVVSPYVIGARRIAAAVFHPAVCDFLESDSTAGEVEWEIEEVALGPTCPIAGKSIREAQLRELTGCTVLALQQSGEARITANPAPDLLLQCGDVLIAVGKPAQLSKLVELAGAGRFRRRSRRART
jgi:voltage-gated potassium channel